MIKIKGKLMMFDKLDLNNRIFPKDCKVDIPDVIPISITDNAGEVLVLAQSIGHITSTTRDESCIAVEGVIINEHEDIYKTIIKENGVYFGGIYTVIDMSEKNGIYTFNSLRLRCVNLFMDDQYGDESLKVEVME